MLKIINALLAQLNLVLLRNNYLRHNRITQRGITASLSLGLKDKKLFLVLHY